MNKLNQILIICLIGCLLLTGCININLTQTQEEQQDITDKSIKTDEEKLEDLGISDINDPNMVSYVEDIVYSHLIDELSNQGYVIENVEARYISKEYLEELAYNSQENIYFGYTLSELENEFEGTKYIFTLGEDGETIVTEFEGYDDTYDQVVRNVAIGTGVILVCVTVSVATAGVAPAVSVIFAASATQATSMALSGAVFGAATSAIATGIQTRNVEQTMKAAALGGSEGFKWGAISGAIMGGAGKYSALRGATTNGLTMNQVAIIQREKKYPLEIIKQIHSMEEYEVYKKAGLVSKEVNGKVALVRDIDLNYVSKLGGKKVTNLERMLNGYAPLDPATGKAYQLHHIGQKSDAALAILTEAEHQGNAAILNIPGKTSEIDREAFNLVRQEFCKSYASIFA